MRRSAVAVIAAALGLALGAGSARAAAPRTPIHHFITLMQENHTFDNYFGTYPGVDGIPPGACVPIDPRKGRKPCFKPFHIGSNSIAPRDLDHSTATARLQYNGGRMDGFISSLRRRNQDGRLAMGYRNGDDLPFYWNLADDYVLYDRFFSSAFGGSYLNHVFWASASPGPQGADRVPPEGLGNLPTIFDRLQKAHVSWKFYVQNYDPRLNYRTFDSGRFPGNRASQVIWVPILNFARYIDNPAIMRHVVPLRDYFKDLDNGRLPEVSYIVPSGPSEHPPSNLASGQAFVRGLINSLMDSEEWRSSAFLLAYDDWGGWYDHVKPPQLPLSVGEGYGYGFRVPALLVSPYARQGYIDSTTLDFTSILRFIEDNWGLRPLTRRDATAKSIAGGFDFKAAPRPASFVSAHRGPAEEEARVVRSRVYLLYLGALGLPVMIVISAVVARMRRRRSGEVLS